MSFLDGRTPASFRSINHGILPNSETTISDASAVVGSVDSADRLLVYDTSAGQEVSATTEQVRGEITDYGVIPAVDPATDQLLIADASAGDAKQRGTIEAITNINNYTTIPAAIDAANDQLLVYDASTGANRKVAVDQLPAAGPAAGFDPLDPIEIGTGATGLAGTDTVVVGADILATGPDAVRTVVVGNNAKTATTNDAVIIGYLANRAGTPSNDSVIIGREASSINYGAIGQEVCIGALANCNSEAVAIGYDSIAQGTGHIAVGHSSTATAGFGAVAVGDTSYAVNSSIAIGVDSFANNDSAALGIRADASGSRSISIGRDSEASAIVSTCIGDESFAAGDASIACGYRVRSRGNRDIGIGHLCGKPTTDTTAGYNILIGVEIAQGITTLAENNIVLGHTAGVSITNATDCICIGTGADCAAAASNAVVIGDNLTNNNDNTMLFGANSVPLMRLQVPGTVTQITSNTTSVTLNATQGEITMSAVLAGTTQAIFTVNNTFIKAGTLIFATVEADQSCSVNVNAVAANSFSFVVRNNTASATTAAPIIHFHTLNTN